MPSIEARIQSVLSQLQMLSEADAAPISSMPGAPGSSHGAPPRGAQLGDTKQGPPPKDRSLFDWYRWHFQEAKTDERKRLLLYLAERDLDGRRHQSPQLRGKQGPEDESASMERVVEWYQGVDALEVAVLEGVNVQHIYKARRKHKRNLSDGRELNQWREWDEERRRIAIANRLSAGHSKTEIADALQISRRTVARYAA